MANEKLDYATLINDVELKISALQTLLNSLKTAQALGALGQMAEGAVLPPSGALAAVGGLASTSGDPSIPAELPEGAFLGKSIPAAIKLYLSVARKKQTIKEIAAALREGGVESTSSTFENVVTGALNRLKLAGEVLRFKDGWGLSEWYPASMRGAAPAAQTKRGKKGKKNKKQAKSAAAPVPPKTEARANVTEIPKSGEKTGTEEQIIQLFQSAPGSELSPKEVIERLGMRSQTVTFILGKLAYKKRLEKTADGRFKMATAS